MMFFTSSTLTFTSQEIHQLIKGSAGISPLHYLWTQFRVTVTYIRLVFLPLYLNFDYDYPVYKSFLELPVLISFLFLGAILYYA